MSSKGLAVSVRGLSKSYALARNAPQHSRITDAVLHALRNPFGRPRQETFWVLQDVDFDIHKGDVVGVIGRNGAGKSTLLKILSRITSPTEGRVDLYGRVGSLLEVGTGFHPELTGRENIALNGAILGMSKREIARQFDAIVEFAEVAPFLDTPVKRYSSGMYVRLAFSVAAHLNPEILIVDEVLAVGDAAFQKKCLGKMKDVSEQDGRTVLFVSHNVGAVRSLCNRGLYLRNGRVACDAGVDAALDEYLESNTAHEASVRWGEDDAPACDDLKFLSAAVLNRRGVSAPTLDNRDEFTIELEYQVRRPLRGLRLGFALYNSQGVLVCGSNDPDPPLLHAQPPGVYAFRCRFPGHILNADRYSVSFGSDLPPRSASLLSTPPCLSFVVEDVAGHGASSERLPGIVKPDLSWENRPLLETALAS